MKELKKHAPVLGLILVVVAAVMLFLEPALVYKLEFAGTVVKEGVDVSAFNVIFGLEDGFDFNILGLVAVVLLVVGGVLPLLKDDKTITLVAAIALIAGGVLMFVFPSTIEVVPGSYQIGWPLIVAGVLGVVAGGINLVKLLA